MNFGIRVKEWDDYICQVETNLTDHLMGKTNPIRVKILDTPATEEAKQKRRAILSRKPLYGPPVIEMMTEEGDGWYLNLPYPEQLVEKVDDSIYAEVAVLGKWFCEGIGVSGSLA